MYIYRIDDDYIDSNASGRIFVSNRGSFDALAAKLEAEPVYFRMYDDDGELYYSGSYYSDSCDIGFEPLDWGATFAGCTEIKYLAGDEWKTL